MSAEAVGDEVRQAGGESTGNALVQEEGGSAPRQSFLQWFRDGSTPFGQRFSKVMDALSMGSVAGAVGVIVGLILGGFLVNTTGSSMPSEGFANLGLLVDFMLGFGLVSFVVVFLLGILRA